MEEGCIFCNIVAGKLAAFKVYEDKKYVAFLDKFPSIEGQTLVVPKKHLDSMFFKVSDKDLAAFIVVSKKVANMLKRRLKVSQVSLVFEGLDIQHLHAKLYPKIPGVPCVKINSKSVFFRCYPGYLTTMMGPMADDAYLRKIQKRIIGR
jgi:diadenosine tetraphosphate (Ap4A) HIT family hydrolase